METLGGGRSVTMKRCWLKSIDGDGVDGTHEEED